MSCQLCPKIYISWYPSPPSILSIMTIRSFARVTPEHLADQLLYLQDSEFEPDDLYSGTQQKLHFQRYNHGVGSRMMGPSHLFVTL
ncbi:unnamed protein product [Rhizophagus irregularis]|nr:unnamed protein product [Rhizophagus irregularis]